jgi:hypothetical protein
MSEHGGDPECIFPYAFAKRDDDVGLPARDCASNKPQEISVGPSKYELQGPTR